MTWAKKFHHSPTRQGLTMLLGLAVALSWSFASSHSYFSVTKHHVFPSLGSWGLDSLHSICLNLLLTFFFLAIGLELSREVEGGSLTRWSTLATPLLGAAGGMIFTALPMIAIGEFTKNIQLTHGWGIPMATDIALTLGALSLLGSRVPNSVRLFVLTLAVLDDVGSIIALGFVKPLALHQWLLTLFAGSTFLVALVIWKKGNRAAVWLALVGGWVLFQRLGLEPALAGAVVGVFAPPAISTIRLEKAMTTLSGYVVLPLFAFCATGISWQTSIFHANAGQLLITIILVRLLGKALGIAVGVRLSELVGGKHSSELHGSVLIGVGFLCAIGFTVPLVFASSVVKVGTTNYNAVTTALLIASVVGGAVGSMFLLRGLATRRVQRGN